MPKIGTRQPRKQIVMKCKDRLTVMECEFLLRELGPVNSPIAKGIIEKILRVLVKAMQESEYAYLIRNTRGKRSSNPPRLKLSE